MRDDEALGVLPRALVQESRVPAVQRETLGEVQRPEYPSVQLRLVQEPEQPERRPQREEDTMAGPVLPGAPVQGGNLRMDGLDFEGFGPGIAVLPAALHAQPGPRRP